MVSKNISNARYPEWRKESPAKMAIKLIAVLGVFVLIIYCMLKILIVNKEPLTADKVAGIISSHGYEAEDITKQYYEMDEGFKTTLDKCVAFQKGDIHFEFFVFKDKNGALDLYGQAYNKITIEYDAIHKIESSSSAGNYRTFSLDSLGKYNAVTWVDTTVVYAYCDSENKEEIISILDEMDYLKGKTLFSANK